MLSFLTSFDFDTIMANDKDHEDHEEPTKTLVLIDNMQMSIDCHRFLDHTKVFQAFFSKQTYGVWG